MSWTAEDAQVHETAKVGTGSKVWNLAQVREAASIGDNCIIGRGAYIGAGVVVGRNSKIQNYALIYEPAKLSSGVFIGPAVVLTNDQFPRAINPNGELKSADDWVEVGVDVGYGASIGVRSVLVAPVKVGRWALVAAGAVVVNDVPDYAIYAGVPARHTGWVGELGFRLTQLTEHSWRCPKSGNLYSLTNGELSLSSTPSSESE